MASVANLLVRMGADFGDTSRQMDDVRNSAEQMGDSAQDAGEKLDGAGHKAEESGDDMEELRDKITEVGKELVKMGAEALGLTSAFEVLKESMEVAAEVESVGVALEQFAGSAEKANEMIEQMEMLSKSEALKFPEVEPAAQHFLALGFSVKELGPSMAAAGNAAWALGMPLESVVQRMGMMAMAGTVSGRYLRTLGISLDDLAKAMGVTADTSEELEVKVRETFKFEDEEGRLNALTVAMQKFAGLGAKEADTLTGKWIEMKNAWHEAFNAMGSDLEGAGKGLETFATQAAKTMQYFLSNTMVDLRNNLRNMGLLHSRYESGVNVDAVGKPAGTGDADKAASDATKAQAQASAKDDQEVQKIRIDAAQKSADSVLKVWIDHWKAMAATGRLAQGDLLTYEKAYNAATLAEAESSISKRRALLSSAPEKDRAQTSAELDAQLLAAKNKFIEANAAADNKELERQHKFIESAVKATEEHVVRQHEMQQKMLSDVEAYAFENAEMWKKVADEEVSARLKAARDAESKHGADIKREESGALGQIKTAQASVELSRSQLTVETMRQRVAYQMQLNELEVERLEVTARSASQRAADSDAIARQSASIAEELNTETARDAAAKDQSKAEDDATAALQAQADITVQILKNQKSINDLKKEPLDQLQQQIWRSGESIPGALGGAIAGGVTHQGRGGMDVGKQIADAMRNIGKELFGDVLTYAIKELVVKLGLQTAAQAAFGAIFGTASGAQTVAISANTVASGANTVALAANTAALVASSASTGGGIAGGILGDLFKVILPGAATGGPVPYDMALNVHAGEHILNADQVAGRAPLPDIPALRGVGIDAGTRGPVISNTTGGQHSVGDVHFHINGAQNTRQTLTDIATNLKQLSPHFAAASVPYSS